jgi:hypothetical protein
LVFVSSTFFPFVLYFQGNVVCSRYLTNKHGRKKTNNEYMQEVNWWQEDRDRMSEETHQKWRTLEQCRQLPSKLEKKDWKIKSQTSFHVLGLKNGAVLLEPRMDAVN